MKLSVFFKKADILLFAVLLLAGAASLLYARSFPAGTPATVSIYVDGELYRSCPLSEDRTIEVSTEYGSNTVMIEDGFVYISESDCPGHLCEAFGRISSPRQIIICAPHHLCVTLDGESEIDAAVF